MRDIIEDTIIHKMLDCGIDTPEKLYDFVADEFGLEQFRRFEAWAFMEMLIMDYNLTEISLQDAYAEIAEKLNTKASTIASNVNYAVKCVYGDEAKTLNVLVEIGTMMKYYYRIWWDYQEMRGVEWH